MKTPQQRLVRDRASSLALRRLIVGVRRRRPGTGVGALLTGGDATERIAAAREVALATGHELYRVDLAAVVGKYIGETEKNLARVFEAAAGSGAILLFDEADALFGRRSDVRDSHDRYANLETSYLLHRIERYDGVVILATNQRAALKPAFRRRLGIVIPLGR